MKDTRGGGTISGKKGTSLQPLSAGQGSEWLDLNLSNPETSLEGSMPAKRSEIHTWRIRTHGGQETVGRVGGGFHRQVEISVLI